MKTLHKTALELARDHQKDGMYLYTISKSHIKNNKDLKKLLNEVYIRAHYDSETNKCVLYKIGYANGSPRVAAHLNGAKKLLYDFVPPDTVLEKVHYLVAQQYFDNP